MLKKIFLKTLVVSLIWVGGSYGEQLYIQPFNNAGKADRTFEDYGWISVTQTGSGLKRNYESAGGIGRNSGVPDEGRSKNANQPADEIIKSGYGYGFYAPIKSEGVIPANAPSLFFLNAPPFEMSIDAVQKMRLHHRCDNTDAELRFAVKIGPQWYISAQDFGGSCGEWATSEMESAHFSDPVQWRLLGVTWGSGGNLTKGGVPTQPLAGTIEAYGVYLKSGSMGGDGPGDHMRFDNFQVFGSPTKWLMQDTSKPAAATVRKKSKKPQKKKTPQTPKQPARSVTPVQPAEHLGFMTS